MTEPWEIRRDLMQRWFAVAISVGFATALVHMNWLNSGSAPNGGESQQLARLIAALVAVVFSYEGYFLSIGKKKLTTALRFYIDFCLVLLYIVLLYTSKIPTWWVYIHTFSFVLYVWWDVLTIRQYPDQYAAESGENALVSAVYVGAIGGRKGYYRGPFVTIIWGMFFIGFSMQQYLFEPRNSWVLLPFVVLALYRYRQDKRQASDDWKSGVNTFSGVRTIVLVLSLWIGLYAVFSLYHGPALGVAATNCEGN
jgi:hypothetical protein